MRLLSTRPRSEAAPEVELPITPMLDMAFQLLTFFLFTYHPSALEGQMELALPVIGETVPGLNPLPERAEPEFRWDEVTVRICQQGAGYTLSIERGLILTPVK